MKIQLYVISRKFDYKARSSRNPLSFKDAHELYRNPLKTDDQVDFFKNFKYIYEKENTTGVSENSDK